METLKNFLILLSLALCWGPSFMFIKLALREVSPLQIVWTRITAGGIFLLIVLLFRKIRLRPFLPHLHWMALVGIFSNIIPFILISYGQRSIHSSLGATLNATTPLFTLVLAHFLVSGERLTWEKIGGVTLGVFGIATIFLPACFQTLCAFHIGGALAVVGASLSYGIGMICSKRIYAKVGTQLAVAMPAGQLLTASLLLLPVALFFEPELLPSNLSPITIGSLAALSVLGSALAFLAYQSLIVRAGASFASFAVLLVPLAGIGLGVGLMNEPVTWNMILGAVAIVSGLLVANRSQFKRSKVTNEESPVTSEDTA